jgi:nicotinamidase/pyrazinamidase
MEILAAKALLLIVDIQSDFMPAYSGYSGVMAIRGGDEVIAPLNALAAAFAAKGSYVAATQDWHPEGHISFASSHNGKNPGDVINTDEVKSQILWPEHCVQGKRGGAFHDSLDLVHVTAIFRKGFRKNLDSYSAFFENDRKTPTGLENWIRGLGIETVIIGGLATDYCVFYSAIDCKALGFTTIIADDAVRGVDIPSGSIDKAVSEMKGRGIVFAHSSQLQEWIR